MPRDSRRERGNSSEREALRSRSRPPKSPSKKPSRDRERTQEQTNDSETERERRERRERRKRREGEKSRKSRGCSGKSKNRDSKSRDRDRDRDRGRRGHNSEGEISRGKSVQERTERERQRRREKAERDRERVRSTSRPAEALALDTDSDDSNSDAQTTSRRYRRSEVLSNPKRRNRPGAAGDEGESSESSESVGLQALNRASEILKGRKDNDQQAAQSRMKHDGGISRGVSLGTGGIKRRVVSGAYMEEGNAQELLRGGASEEYEKFIEKRQYYDSNKAAPQQSCMDWWTKKRLLIVGVISTILLIIIVVVAVVVSKNKNGSGSGSSGSLGTSSKDCGSVPTEVKNTDMDPCSWYDTTDFNLTYTNETIGDLPIIGLYSDWDDSAQANDKVPPLNKDWGNYTSRPARGVNLGGWLSLEPFIAPSMFSYSSTNQIIDEYTLTTKLGGTAKPTLEKHYAEFITEDDFKQIAAAGLDHVRIQYSYWAVEVYDDDPYVFRTSWRYLLRGIEWARKYGLRVNLDLHALPGSQNGWNHSGRQGLIEWLNGTNGDTNAQRSLDVHDRLSKFFAQDRYRNIIAFYGLVNEPKMTALNPSDVISWTEKAYKLVRDNGIKGAVVFGDGFMGLANWKGKMTGYGDTLILDVHQYVIFNTNQIVYNHAEKVTYACSGWTNQTEQSMDTNTGFGPTMFAEWSQADTDCAYWLTNVGWGNRWTGTYKAETSDDSVLTPRCPTENDTCDCNSANADPSEWSDQYKMFLKDFAEAQMYSFEKGWGWWYWTWKTEDAPQWSYQAGLAAGVLPEKAYDRNFDCSNLPPSYSGLPETY